MFFLYNVCLLNCKQETQIYAVATVGLRMPDEDGNMKRGIVTSSTIMDRLNQPSMPMF